jgi:hypothetical protein
VSKFSPRVLFGRLLEQDDASVAWKVTEPNRAFIPLAGLRVAFLSSVGFLLIWIVVKENEALS